MSFEKLATKTDLLDAARMLELVLSGKSIRAVVAEDSELGVAKAKLRIAYIAQQCRSRLPKIVTLGMTGSAKDFKTHPDELASALEGYRAALAMAPEIEPIAWLKEQAKGDLVGLPDRALHCLWSLHIYDKAQLTNAVRQGRINREVPNLPDRVLKSILNFANS